MPPNFESMHQEVMRAGATGHIADRRLSPASCWSAPCPEGLRVHVLCPAGIAAGDLQEVREQLAAACFAADVRVERDPRHATVVVLVIVTRVPVP